MDIMLTCGDLGPFIKFQMRLKSEIILKLSIKEISFANKRREFSSSYVKNETSVQNNILFLGKH